MSSRSESSLTFKYLYIVASLSRCTFFVNHKADVICVSLEPARCCKCCLIYATIICCIVFIMKTVTIFIIIGNPALVFMEKKCRFFYLFSKIVGCNREILYTISIASKKRHDAFVSVVSVIHLYCQNLFKKL